MNDSQALAAVHETNRTLLKLVMRTVVAVVATTVIVVAALRVTNARGAATGGRVDTGVSLPTRAPDASSVLTRQRAAKTLRERPSRRQQ